jgi:hypothetical protein
MEAGDPLSQSPLGFETGRENQEIAGDRRPPTRVASESVCGLPKVLSVVVDCLRSSL